MTGGTAVASNPHNKTRISLFLLQLCRRHQCIRAGRIVVPETPVGSDSFRLIALHFLGSPALFFFGLKHLAAGQHK